MKLNKLASAISRGKWLIEPRTYAMERVRAINFLQRTAEIEQAEEIEIEPAYIIRTDTYSKVLVDNWSGEIIGLAASGNVCVIPISGVIMKSDWCGSPGTDTLSSWLKSAIASPQIDAIVLLINSGGGSVEGTGEFADLVKLSAKTIFAFCDGLMASAAYWIGCSANEVWASHATCEFGSIGTAVCFMDDTKYMEEMGFKDIYINADSSPDKNQDILKAIDGDTTGLKDNIINPTNEIFMSAVKANRDGKLKLSGDGEYKEPLTGKVYLSETAIENGLIDGICTLEQCIEKVLDNKTNENKTLNSTKMAVTTEEKDKAVRKNTTLLEKIQALFASDKEAETIADEDEEAKKGKKAEDDEEEMSAKKKGGKKSDKKDPKDDDVDDDDDDDDSDEDEVEVNGKTIKVNKAAKAAIEELVNTANKEIADRDALLAEAETLIAENTETLKKDEKEIRETIKSTFTIKGSQRSAKLGVTEKTSDAAEGNNAFMPRKGSVAERKLMSATMKAAAEAKELTARVGSKSR